MVKRPTVASNTPSANERTVIKAAGVGEIADFSTLEKPPVLRAAILHLLITGLAQDKRKTVDPVTPRGVRIKNAIISGALDFSGWSGRADDPSRPLPTLEFEDCTINEPVYLDESHIHSLSFLGCTLPLLSAGSARIDGSVRLSGSTLKGANDKYAGQKLALDFAGAVIGGNVILRPYNQKRFTAKQEVTFLGAQIEGAFNANGASLQNPGGVALNFTRVDIRNSVFLTVEADYRFETIGETRFWIATIGGQFAANGAKLQNPGGEAMSFQGAVIRGNVFLRPSTTGLPFSAIGDVHFTGARIESSLITSDVEVQGVFGVRNAHCEALFDDPETGWPQQSGALRLAGLTYTRLHQDDEKQREHSVGTRLDWIKRQYINPEQPTKDEFDPQPFTQYAKTLRARGQSSDADRVLIEMHKLRLRSHTDFGPIRLLHKFLGLTSGYGYSGTRAVMALLVWIMIGSGMYGAHAFAGHFGPAEQVGHGDHRATPDTLVSMAGIVPKKVRGCPGLIAPLYAMDTILPIVEFGQRRACAFDPLGKAGAPLWRALDFLYALIGAVLFAISVVTLTGLLRED